MDVMQTSLEDAFNQNLEYLGCRGNPLVLAVAVSGGRDSMALLNLAVAKKGVCHVVALTVDHGLRPESSHEAHWVGAYCSALGVEHHTLLWRECKPKTGIQSAARDARYRLLSHFCHQKGIIHLLVGHHAQDNIETIIMRQARTHKGGASLGLAGLSASIIKEGVRVLRPLLTFTRDEITQYCKSSHIPWLEDVSNQNAAYERVRVRNRDLVTFYDRDSCVKARQALEAEARSFSVLHIRPDFRGCAEVTLTVMNDFSCRAVCLAIAWAVRWVRGRTTYLPSLEKVETILGNPGVNHTLLGVLFLWKKGALHLYREARHLPLYQKIPIKYSRWDERFDIYTEQPVTVAPLGKVSSRRLNGLKIASWPAVLRRTWPVVWDQDAPVLDGEAFSYKVCFNPSVALVPPPFVAL